jgi:hypothetical protein
MVENSKERETLEIPSVAATLEKANTYVFAESPIRNAEATKSRIRAALKRWITWNGYIISAP